MIEVNRPASNSTDTRSSAVTKAGSRPKTRVISMVRTAVDDPALDGGPDDDAADCEEVNDMRSSHAKGALESMAQATSSKVTLAPPPDPAESVPSTRGVLQHAATLL